MLPPPMTRYRERFLDEGETPRPIPHELVFVHPEASRFREIVDADPVPLPGAVHDRFRRGADAWTLVSYLVLKARGHAVRLEPAMLPGRLCIAHRDYVIARELPVDSYIVAVRADRGPLRVAHWQIVQSSILEEGRSRYLPYWPQPGLRPRDPARGTRVERVGFMGRERNLAEGYRDPDFRRRLGELGMELVVVAERADWSDYTDLDAILAVREGNPRWLSTKPASKLVNSWHAGCPAVLGPEPAYEALRQGPLDFLCVRRPEEALDALASLRSPDRYRAMVENGHLRSADFTVPAVARAWEALLADHVGPAFEAWSRRPAAWRRSAGMVRFVWRAALDRFAPNPYRR